MNCYIITDDSTFYINALVSMMEIQCYIVYSIYINTTRNTSSNATMIYREYYDCPTVGFATSYGIDVTPPAVY